MGCYLLCVPFLASFLFPCWCPPVWVSAGLFPLLFFLCSVYPICHLVMRAAYRREKFWFLPLCQKRQNRPHIFLMGKGRRQGGTHIPRGSHLGGTMCEPGRLQKSVRLWHSWSPAVQNQPFQGLPSHHLVNKKNKKVQVFFNSFHYRFTICRVTLFIPNNRNFILWPIAISYAMRAMTHSDHWGLLS